MRSYDKSVSACFLKLFEIIQIYSPVNTYWKMWELFLYLSYSIKNSCIKRVPLVPYLLYRHKVDEIHKIKKRRKFIYRFVNFYTQPYFCMVATFHNTFVRFMNNYSLYSHLYPAVDNLFWRFNHQECFEILSYRCPNIFFKYIEMHKWNFKWQSQCL